MFGWFKKHGAAIAEALSLTYPGAELLWFSTPEARRFQLASVAAVLVEEPAPHWVMVSRGLVEVGSKAVELTCRVPARARTPEKDFSWVLSWMQGLADYLAESGAHFDAYHNKKMVQPNEDDATCALVFVDDVALSQARSSKGRFSFLQMVGLTADEHQACGSWNARSFVELIRERNPLLLTDHLRQSYLRDENFATKVTEGRDRDGSSMAMIVGVPILWFQEAKELQIHFPDEGLQRLLFGLRHRLAHGNSVVLLGDRRREEDADGRVVEHAHVNVVLQPEQGPSRVEDRDGVKAAVLRIGPEARTQLIEALEPTPGAYAVPNLPGVRFIVARDERFADAHYPW